MKFKFFCIFEISNFFKDIKFSQHFIFYTKFGGFLNFGNKLRKKVKKIEILVLSFNSKKVPGISLGNFEKYPIAAKFNPPSLLA